MGKFLALYMFHRFDSLSISRLLRLRSMNPDVTVIPCFGVRQSLHIPTGLDFHGVRYVGPFNERVNSVALRSSHLFRLLRFMNEKVETLRRGTELASLRSLLNRNEMSLHCDFTPMGIWNLDLSILTWFATNGKILDFEHLIFYEYDTCTTKTILEIYDEYTRFDAAFVDLRKASSEWSWYNYPPAARKTIVRWLEKRGLKPILYACLFAANMLSRRTLEVLADLPLPYGFCEMRLPTVLVALGFNCGKLDFPMVRYRPALSIREIECRPDLGIFHPVKVE